MCTVTKESLVSTCVWECANTSETHASRFGVPNRRRYRLTVGHRPRSAVVRHRCRKGIARERRVDRYYDPNTTQWLSVDPDVAQTGQPYAFTGDDPVNRTDPQGLLTSGPGGQLCEGHGPNEESTCNSSAVPINSCGTECASGGQSAAGPPPGPDCGVCPPGPPIAAYPFGVDYPTAAIFHGASGKSVGLSSTLKPTDFPEAPIL
jgi:hypothetical protein